MTSISIISGVVARSLLFLQQQDESKHQNIWRNGAKELLSGLIRINQRLIAADPEIKQRKEIVDLEKKIVQLSYDIGDALILISSKPKGILSRSSRLPDLKSLKTQLMISERRLQTGLFDDQEDKSEQTNRISTSTSVQREISHEAININPASIIIPTGQEEQLTEALLKRPDSRVVCLWGESGMGKTILAKKVFDDAQVVRQHFKLFAWVPLKRDFQIKHVLQAILRKLLLDRPRKLDMIRGMHETQLTQEILIVLQEKRCLVVLEDIWDVQDWQSIHVAFPVGNYASKILITTTSKEVAAEVTSQQGLSYKMEALTEAQCLKMLTENASFKDDAGSQSVGKIIFSLSRGSPSTALLLGRALKTADASARNQLLQDLRSCLSRNEISGGAINCLELCYRRLPHGLKPCLLYMGQFPIAKNIEAEKIYLLLAAEGLILPDNSKKRKTKSMESVRTILEKLSLKRLVETEEDEASMTRMYESYRLHDQIRKFCINKGQDEEFFEILDFQNRKKLRQSTRRLAIYLSKNQNGNAILFSNQDMVKKIRSLLIFDAYESQQKSTLPAEINDLKEFSALRVLDFEGVNFRGRKVPRGICKLVNLIYLSFRGCYLDEYPSSLTNFPCLETLDLRVAPDCTMTIPNVLFKMKRLKHLYFPLLYRSIDGKSKLQLDGMERLEILVNFDTGVCNTKDLLQLKNLEMFTAISEGNHKDFDDIVKYLSQKKETDLQQSSLTIRKFDGFSRDRVTAFGKLLLCECLQSLHIEGRIGNLPENVEISHSFTEIIFNGSELENDPMNVLGKLRNLQTLVLRNDAFVGNEMTFSAATELPSLKILKLINLRDVEKLTFEQGAMPKLSTLIIENCECLKEVLMPKALNHRLRLAQEKEGYDVYFVEPRATINNYDT